jgi:hypothetical protein
LRIPDTRTNYISSCQGQNHNEKIPVDELAQTPTYLCDPPTVFLCTSLPLGRSEQGSHTTASNLECQPQNSDPNLNPEMLPLAVVNHLGQQVVPHQQHQDKKVAFKSTTVCIAEVDRHNDFVAPESPNK